MMTIHRVVERTDTERSAPTARAPETAPPSMAHDGSRPSAGTRRAAIPTEAAVAKLEARTGKRVSPRAFIFQNLEQLAREYDGASPPPTTPAPTPTRPAPAPPTSRLRRWLSSLK